MTIDLGMMSPRQARTERKPIISLRGVAKTYETPAGSFLALSDIDLELMEGEFVAVIGKSGSGKSTLMNVLTGIDRPSAGSIVVGGEDIRRKTESQLAAWRGRNVGVVFQFFQLLPTLTIAENVMLPMELCSTVPRRERRPRALELLRRVGIADQADKFPAMLSGGQQQRAAIARALANDPPLLVADEPTGNLDTRTAGEVLELFSALAAQGTTIVLVTHEPDVLRLVDRSITLTDGKVEAASPVDSGSKE
jgi:putative ABC transport system ATP-binding protein